MSQVITRTFESQEQAKAAARELLDTGFPRDGLHILVYRGEDNAGSEDRITDELRAMGIDHDEARRHVRSLKEGQALLTATPPDVSERTADILDRHDPVDTGRPASGVGADPAPLSHALHLKVLSDDPAPLSHLLHIPVLSDD